MNTTKILVDIENLLNKPIEKEDIVLLQEYSKVVQEFEAQVVLKDNPIVLRKIETFKKELNIIDSKLLDRKTEQKDRDYLFAKKDILQEFLKTFDGDFTQNVLTIKKGVENFQKRLKAYA